MTSGFERMPTQREVMAYDPRWLTDMQLMYKIYSFYKNDSPLFNIASQEDSFYEDIKSEKEGYDRDGNIEEWAQTGWSALLEKIREGEVDVEE